MQKCLGGQGSGEQTRENRLGTSSAGEADGAAYATERMVVTNSIVVTFILDPCKFL